MIVVQWGPVFVIDLEKGEKCVLTSLKLGHTGNNDDDNLENKAKKFEH